MLARRGRPARRRRARARSVLTPSDLGMRRDLAAVASDRRPARRGRGCSRSAGRRISGVHSCGLLNSSPMAMGVEHCWRMMRNQLDVLGRERILEEEQAEALAILGRTGPPGWARCARARRAAARPRRPAPAGSPPAASGSAAGRSSGSKTGAVVELFDAAPRRRRPRSRPCPARPPARGCGGSPAPSACARCRSPRGSRGPLACA